MQVVSTISATSGGEACLRKRDPLAAESGQRLKSAGYSELRDLSCEYHEGVLILRGTVTCFYHKQLAQEIVKQTPGIEMVMNFIEVQSFIPRGVEH